ncbi:Nucleolar complex protein 2-like protein [Elsinoe fawcettii]|nr:Nucleolar complex protein 2-like protein [Elsinoe fawcettii]
MAQSKATKKFERNHLKDTIKKRKEGAKIKQRHAVNAKKKARRAADVRGDGEDEEKDNTAKSRKQIRDKKDAQDFENMNMDDFFQSGLDLGDTAPKSSKGKKRKRGEENGTSATTAQSDGDDASDTGDEQDLEGHQEQLKGLAEKDPEFYKYLEENDPELLDLEKANFDELELSSDEEDAGSSRKKSKVEEKVDDGEVTQGLLKKWEKSLVEQHSLRASRELVLAFRAAAHSADEEDKTFKYSVSSPEVYHELLVLALKRLPEVLQHHLPVKESTSGKIRLSTESKKFSTLSPLIKSYLSSLIYLLGYLTDALTLRMTLASIETLLPYTLSFKKLVRDLAKNVVGIWSTSSFADSSRLAAFLVLRKLIVIGDPSIRESVLKAVYQGFVKGARNTTVHTLSGINLMKNSAAELWGLDSSIGYTSGFNFIRQLAVHLRGTITNNANDSYKLVYNWQYVHSLDFWSRVLSMHCDSLTEAKKGQTSPLRPLIYPVVQVTLGALRLIPTAAYFPLRFHLTRSLLRISSSTGTYIPLASTLHEVLQSSEMRKPPKGSSLKALDFSITIRAQKSYLGTRVYQDGIGEQVQELMSEFFVLWSKNIAFPELSLPVIILLKRWLKEVGPHSKHPNQNSKVSGMIGLLVQKLDANCKWVEERRAKVEFAPNNKAGVEGFLREVEWDKTPLGAFVKGQRRVRVERAKVMEEARKEEEKRRAEERGAGVEKTVNGKKGRRAQESEDEVHSDDDEDVSEEEMGQGDEDEEMDDDSE